MIRLIQPALALPTLLGLLTACGGGSGNSPEATTPATVTLSLPHAEGTPMPVAFVAYQDGQGAWKPVAATGGSYTFTVADPGGRYSLALGLENETTNRGYVQLWRATVAELPAPSFDLGGPLAPGPERAWVVGSVDNLVNEEAQLAVGDRVAYMTSLSATNFSMYVPKGKVDLALSCMQNGIVTRMKLMRDLAIEGDTPLNVDSTDQTFQLGTLPSHVMGQPAGVGVEFSDRFQVSKGGSVWLGYGNADAQGNFQMPVVPTERLLPGDFHQISLEVEYGGSAYSETDQWIRPAAGQTFQLIAPPDPTFTFTPGGASVQGQWPAVPQATQYLAHLVQVGGADHRREWAFTLTPGYLGAGPVALSMPDLSALPGWNAGFGLGAANSPLVWEAMSVRFGDGHIGHWEESANTFTDLGWWNRYDVVPGQGALIAFGYNGNAPTPRAPRAKQALAAARNRT